MLLISHKYNYCTHCIRSMGGAFLISQTKIGSMPKNNIAHFYHVYSSAPSAGFRKLSRTLFLLSCCLLLVITSNAQERITLKAAKTPLLELIKNIEKQSGYHFMYSKEDVGNYREMNIAIENASLKAALQQLFSETKLF